jgi:hypothetical protein
MNKWASEDPPEQIQRKLQTKAPVNYWYLNNPFPDEADTKETHLTYEIMAYHTILGSDDPLMVGEAKN